MKIKFITLCWIIMQVAFLHQKKNNKQKQTKNNKKNKNKNKNQKKSQVIEPTENPKSHY